MHECPDCGQVCTCDGDDTWMDSESENCAHEHDDLTDDDLEAAADEEDE